MPNRLGPLPPIARMLAIAIAVVAPSGCGSSGPEMARVSGTVSYKGAPLSQGVVAFVSTDPARPNASGVIQPDGSYELQTQLPGDGAQPGEYKIAVSDVDPEALNTSLPGEPVEVTSTLPVDYKNPETSGLTRTVESGRNTFNLDLQ